MSADAVTFHYNNLQPGQIRLLTAEIQANGQEQWTLETVQLRDEPDTANHVSLEYDALSYTWGDQSHTFPITCNGQRMNIHENLKDALPFLARRNSNLPIWIDAICINQADNREKIAQIRIMLQIYKHASHVCVWLGKGTDQNDKIIRVLPKLLSTADQDDAVTKFTAGWSTLPKKIPELESDEDWASLYALVENKWYGRLWVFQEVVFAKDIQVLLGANEVDWELLQRMVLSRPEWHFAGANSKNPRRPTESLSNIFHVKETVQKATISRKSLTAAQFAKILIYSMGAHCLEPRDRVFAVAGFIQLQIPDGATLANMYVRLARSVFLNLSPKSDRWWSLLHEASSAGKRTGLPSWCPDFHDVEGRSWSTKFQRISKTKALMIEGEENFSASKRTSSAQKAINLDDEQLVLRGLIFDRICEVLPGFQKSETESALVRDFHAWERSLADVLTIRHMRELVDNTTASLDDSSGKMHRVNEDVYWTILQGGYVKNKLSTYPTVEEFRQAERLVLPIAEAFDLADQSSSTNRPTTQENPFAARHAVQMGQIGRVQEGRRFFITQGGRIGFGPSNISVGQRVCIFSWSKTAHVLDRAENDEKEQYTLIGDAYVHNMMYGEIEELKIQEQDIILV